MLFDKKHSGAATSAFGHWTRMKTIALDLDDTLVDTIAALLGFIEETRGFRVDETRLAAYQLGADEKQTAEIISEFYDAQAHHESPQPRARTKPAAA
jgi:hypothetical protein